MGQRNRPRKGGSRKSHNSDELRKAQWEANVLRDALQWEQINISTEVALDLVALLHDQDSWNAWAAEGDEWSERVRRFHERLSHQLENDPKWRSRWR